METKKPLNRLNWAFITLAAWFVFLLVYDGLGFGDRFFTDFGLCLFALVTALTAIDALKRGRVNVFGCVGCAVGAAFAAYAAAFAQLNDELRASHYASGYRFEFSDVIASELFIRLIIGGLIVAALITALTAILKKLKTPVIAGIIAAGLFAYGFIAAQRGILAALALAVFGFVIYMLLIVQDGFENKKGGGFMRFVPLIGAVVAFIIGFAGRMMDSDFLMFAVPLLALAGAVIAACGRAWGARLALVASALMFFAAIMYALGINGEAEKIVYVIPPLVNIIASGWGLTRYKRADAAC